MQIRRSILVLVMVLTAALALTACGGGSTPAKTTAPAAAPAPAKDAAPAKAPAQAATPAPAAPTPAAPAKQFPPGPLRMGTVSAGGTWHLYGTNLANLAKPVLPQGYSIEVLPQAGGAANLDLIDTGKAELAFTFTSNAMWAKAGTVAYTKKYPDLRGLLGAFADPLKITVVAPKDAPFNSLDEIKAKQMKIRFVTYPKKTAGDIMAGLLFAEHGFSYDDIQKWGGSVSQLDSAVAIQLMKDGRGDLLVMMAGTRQPNLVELTQGGKFKFIPLSAPIQESLSKKYGVMKWTYKSGDYDGITGDVAALADYTALVTSTAMPDNVAYSLVKMVNDKAKDIQASHASLKSFDPTQMWKPEMVGGLPLHPGAVKYYKEVGWLK